MLRTIVIAHATMYQTQPVDDDHHPLLVATLPNTVQKGSNVLVIQRVLGTPFELDVAFVPHADYTNKPKLTDAELSAIVASMSPIRERHR
jgi:hypothetical protein